MKAKVLLLVGLSATALFSCKKNDKETAAVPQEKPLFAFSKLEKFPSKVVNLTTTNAASLKDIKDQAKLNATIVDETLWPGGNGKTLVVETKEQVVLDEFADQVYPGAIFTGPSVASGDFTPVTGYTKKPITVGLSLVGKSVTGTIPSPSWTSTQDFLSNSLLAGFSGKQLASFSFDMNQFTDYNEMKLTFGANVSVSSVLSIGINGKSTKIKKKFGLTAKFLQKNFTMNMDIPKDGQLIDGTIDPTFLGKYSPVYVNSITYGRLGIVVIESDDNYEELSLAFKAAFNIGVVKGDVGVTLDQKAIINRASIKVYLVGGKGETGVQTINGYDDFKQHILKGGEFTADDPGVPIFFRLRYLSDHSLYKTKFNIDLPN